MDSLPTSSGALSTERTPSRLAASFHRGQRPSVVVSSMRTSSPVLQAVRHGPSSRSYCRTSACSAAELEAARERLPRSSTTVTAAPSVPAVVVAAREVTSCSAVSRSEEHTSELQSRQYLVCRLLLEKKKTVHS